MPLTIPRAIRRRQRSTSRRPPLAPPGLIIGGGGREAPTPPEVLDVTPGGVVLDPVGVVRVTFDEPIAPASFTPDDVTYTGPGGPIAVAEVRAVGPAGDSGVTQFEIVTAEQSMPGDYALVIGPGLTDLAGTPMAEATHAGFTILDAINVRDFGAVGDGVHDDKAAIDAAIAAAPAGSTVYFPPGTYRVAFSDAIPGATDRIAIAKDVRILGAGSGATTVAFPPDVPTFNWYGFYIAGPEHNVEIADMTIRGQQGNTLGVNTDGVPIGYPIYRASPSDGADYDAELRLSRVEMDNDGIYGVISAAGHPSRVWTGRIGLVIEDSVLEGWFVGLSVFNGSVGEDDLFYLHVRRSTIRANGHNSRGNGYATYIHPNVSVDFDRVTFGKATSGYGFRMYGESPVGSPQYVRIRNSDFTPDLQGTAILLGDPRGRGVIAEIEGNTFRNSGAAIQVRHSAVVRDSVFSQTGRAIGDFGGHVSADERREVVVTLDGSTIEKGDVVNPFGAEGSTLLIRNSVLRGNATVTSHGGYLEITGSRDEADGIGLISIYGGQALIAGNEFRGDHYTAPIRIGDHPGTMPDRVEVRDNTFSGPTVSQYLRNRVFHFKAQYNGVPLPDGVLVGGGNTLRPSGYTDLWWNQFGGPSEGVPTSLWAPLVPEAPANLAASAAGGGQINLAWDDAVEMVGFPDPVDHWEVYRGTTAGFAPDLSGGTNLMDGTLQTSDYTDTTAAAGITYFYRVYAVTTSGVRGPGSAEVSATPSPS